LLGILIGISLGFYFSLQGYLAHIILQSIKDEVSRSCAGECLITAEEFRIHLLRMNGVARRIVLSQKGRPETHVGLLRAKFAVSQIYPPIVDLSEVTLEDAKSKAFAPTSAIFKFIDHLTSDSPPDTPKPFVKVRLNKLRLLPAFLEHDFGSVIARVVNATVEVDRENTGLFSIIPSAENVSLYLKESNRTVSLGKLSTEFKTGKPLVEVPNLLLSGESQFSAHYSGGVDIERKNSLSGLLRAGLSMSFLNLEPLLKGNMGASLRVAGTLDEIKLIGDAFTGSSGLTVQLAENSTLQCRELGAKVNAVIVESDYKISLSDFFSSDPLVKVRSESNVTIEPNRFSGEIKLDATYFSFGNFSVESPSISLSFQSEGITFFVNSPLLSAFNQRIGPAKIKGNFNFRSDILTLNINAFNDLKSETLQSGMQLAFGEKRLLVEGNIKLLDWAYGSLSSLASLSGQAKFSGDILTQTFYVSGSGIMTSITPDIGLEKIPFSVTTKNDVLSVSLEDKLESVRALVFIPLRGAANSRNPISIDISLTNFAPVGSKFTNSCIKINGRLKYTFMPVMPMRGNGNLSPFSGFFGCRHPLSVVSRESTPITNGTFVFAPTELASLGAITRIGGKYELNKGLDVGMHGQLKFEAFAPFFPSADEVRGSMQLNAHVTGSFKNPRLTGQAQIANGGVIFADSGIDVTNLSGSLKLEGDVISASALSGEFNGGLISVDGEIHLSDFTSSYARVKLQDAFFTPSPETSVTFDANLLFSQLSDSKPVIQGEVEVASAEFAKTITLRTILQDILKFLLDSRPKQSMTEVAKRSVGASAPPLALDVAIKAPKNVSILTNWAQIELSGALRVLGTLAEPRFSGRIETIGGWFGLRNRRFDITSATLTFEPGKTIPTIDLLSEATLRSWQGETVLVFLEVDGSVSAPQISFSSDRGYSEQELLLMLASGGGGVSEGPVSLGLGLEYLDVSIGRKDTTFFLENVVYNLTRIDSILLEPTFNPATGSLDPAVFAEKRLTDSVVLSASRVFSDTFAQSDFLLRWRIFSHTSLDGGFRTLIGQVEPGVESNLRFSIIDANEPQVVIEARGNWSITQAEIEKELRINASTRIFVNELPLRERSLVQYYRRRGYFDAEIKASCKKERDSRCLKLRFTINEGSQYKIGQIIIPSSLPIGIVQKEIDKFLPIDEYATEGRRERLERRLLRLLRLKGYFGARVKAAYRDKSQLDDNGKAIIEVSFEEGMPLSFKIEGNNEFSDEILLEPLYRTDRLQPYGSNVVRLLKESILEKYRLEGFQEASVETHEVSQDEILDTGMPENQSDFGAYKRTFVIKVNEGVKRSTNLVKIYGIEAIGKKRLLSHLKKLHGISDLNPYLNPTVVTDELKVSFTSLLLGTLSDLGYGDANVSVATNIDNKARFVVIYEVKLGEITATKNLKMDGMPFLGSLIPFPEPPYSVPRINRFIERVANILKERGFFTSSVSLIFDMGVGGHNDATVLVHPGKRATINKLEIKGNKLVKNDVILKTLDIHPGSPWSADDIRQGVRRLYRLGLFSRIRTSSLDGALDNDSETLVLDVEERPLQSLVVGAGANSELGAHFFTEASDRSFFSDGKLLSLKVDLYYEPRLEEISRGTSSLIFSVPQAFQTDYTWVNDFGFQRLVAFNQEYDLARLSALSYFNSDQEKNISFFLGHSVFFDELTNVSSDAVLSPLDINSVTISALIGRVIIDYRDNPLDPREGVAFTSEIKIASEMLGSEANFGTFDSRLSAVLPGSAVFERFSLGFTSRFGISNTWADTQAVPITQRFYLGGRRTVRGFRENSLGPRGVMGAVIGGDMTQYNSAELRYLVDNRFSTHLFLDSGNVFLRKLDAEIDHQRVSAGWGLQYLSPIGPVGLDLGFPLDQKEGEPSVRLHFSIGSRF
jgi:outer membrane protein insertion porin family